ncbi:hypothetical protein MSG28_000011 [Choristoneura fumiferana]|uniref:Uncharacterized protein n=1 Tax=Choristoneura fumiferana TaxID=7141 RepID=A0ACC0JZ05_CHOFU|nr:hypothetical protein MSG28_000011 [Choristoneura fumiferana]
MCGITFEIYHELCGEGKHRGETCTSLQSNSMVCVKFPIRAGPAWELWPKPSCSERRPVPSSGTLSEGRSQSLTRAEPRNGFRSEAPAPHPSRHRHDDQGTPGLPAPTYQPNITGPTLAGAGAAGFHEITEVRIVPSLPLSY